MILVQKMYIRDFLKTLCILTLGLALIFSIIGLTDKAEEFIPHKPPAQMLALYALYSLPKFVQYMLPMAVLLSSLFIFSQAIRRREIIVIKAAGGKMQSLLRPFVVLGVLLTVAGFLLGEVLVPYSAKNMRSIANQITKKEKNITFKEGTLYMRSRDGSVVRVGLYLPDSDSYRSITIFRFAQDGLVERIDAATATWKEDHWKLNTVNRLSIATGKTTFTPEMTYEGIESPATFQEGVWKVEEMSLMELISFKNRLQEAGYKNIRLLTDISSRAAYPIINLFMLLLGISLSIGGDQRLLQLRLFQSVQSHAGIVSAGIGLIISLAYWLGYSFFLSLGYAGTLPPTLAPWIIPVIFSGISAYLFINIPE